MIVYKYFLKNAFRRRYFALIYLAIFIFLSVINTANLLKKNTSNFENYRPNLAVMNESQSELSQNLEEYLRKISKIQMAPETILQAKEMIFTEKVDAVIRMPGDFDERLSRGESSVEILYDYKNIKGHIIENQLYKYLIFVNATKGEDDYNTQLVEKVMEEEVQVRFRNQENSNEHLYRQYWFIFFFNFSGYLIIAVFIGIIGLTMSDFQQEEVAVRIQSASMSNFRIQIQTYLGQLSIAAIITALIILIGIALQKGNLNHIAISKYIVNLSIFSLAVLSMTFMINNITNNKVVKSALSTVISLGMAFISGVMVPQEYISSFTLKVAHFFPMYYFVKINDNISIQWSELCHNLSMQFLFALAFLVVGIYFARLRQTRGKA